VTIALAFDVYGTLVDPIALARTLDRLLPGDGLQVAQAWRQKQLETTFRLTAMEQYRDFAWVTRRALAYALASAGRSLDEAQQEALIAGYDQLPAYADAVPALAQLRDAGHTIVVLSNGTPAMLEAVLSNSGLRACIQDVISVDEVQAYKPAPRVYQHAARRLSLQPAALRLVSSNPFDVVGAQAAGLSAAWVRRLPHGSIAASAAGRAAPLPAGDAYDTLASPPDVVVPALTELAPALEAAG
jgi:2-haloacid dehalogenase